MQLIGSAVGLLWLEDSLARIVRKKKRQIPKVVREIFKTVPSALLTVQCSRSSVPLLLRPSM